MAKEEQTKTESGKDSGMAKEERTKTEFGKESGKNVVERGLKMGAYTSCLRWGVINTNLICQKLGHDPGYLLKYGGPDHEYCYAGILLSMPSTAISPLPVAP